MNKKTEDRRTNMSTVHSDVIDWERATGNILKMILGSIDPGMDGATDGPMSDGGGDRPLSDNEDEWSPDYSPHRMSNPSRMSQETSMMGGHLDLGKASTIDVAQLSLAQRHEHSSPREVTI
jgi:hypothetical protein